MSYSEPPWTRDIMVDKFRWLAGHVLETSQIDELLDMAWHFEEIGQVSELTNRLK